MIEAHPFVYDTLKIHVGTAISKLSDELVIFPVLNTTYQPIRFIRDNVLPPLLYKKLKRENLISL